MQLGLVYFPAQCCYWDRLFLMAIQLIIFVSADSKGWLIVAYLSLIMQPLAYGTWYHVIGRNPIHKVMPMMLLLSLTGLSTAIFLLGEEPTKQVFVGGAIILFGIGMILFTKTPKK